MPRRRPGPAGPSARSGRREGRAAAAGRPCPVVLADRRLLIHALVNLIKNAVEASASAGMEPVVTISARVEGTTAGLSISDNGPGIPPDELRRIFEAGYSTKGTGPRPRPGDRPGGNRRPGWEPRRGKPSRVRAPGSGSACLWLEEDPSKQETRNGPIPFLDALASLRTVVLQS